MTNAVQVFPVGYRLTDSSTGAPLSGASIEFYDAGTLTAKTVYNDQDLQGILGSVIVTDALGYPTSDGTTKTLIFVGTSSYKIIIRSSTGSIITQHDNIKGAVTVYDPTASTVNSSTPILTKNVAYAVTVSDQNKILPVDCSNGSITVTLPSTADVGMSNGWSVTIQHAGSANLVTISTVSSQLLYYGKVNLGTSASLLTNGEQMTLISDGGNWRISPRTQIFTPVGTIMMHGANTPPVGWLTCNGLAISRTTYSSLFASISTTFGTGDGVTTFNVPDMRGYFARGWDGDTVRGARGVDTGRAFGSNQADDYLSHNHGSLTSSGPKSYSAGAISGLSSVTVSGLGSVLTHESASHSTSSSATTFGLNGPVSIPSSGGTETRPKNLSLLYIIKY